VTIRTTAEIARHVYERFADVLLFLHEAGDPQLTAEANRFDSVRLESQAPIAPALAEAGVLRPALDWYSVGDILDGMAPHLPAILGSRRLQINVQDGIGLIRVDLLRIEELLINLMENAGRYTHADSPIELRVGADANGLSIAVVDHEPGIPRSHRHHIFEAFARGHGHTDRDHGTGRVSRSVRRFAGSGRRGDDPERVALRSR